MTAVLNRRVEQFAEDRGSDNPSFVPLRTKLERLLDTGGAVPRAEFLAELRDRLLAEAEVALVPSPSAAMHRPISRPRRRLVAAATALALVCGTTGVAVATRSVLPSPADRLLRLP